MRAGENDKTSVIHPKWAMEEYAIIFRTCVWLSPPHPPMIVERMAIIIRRLVFNWWLVKISSDIGASFCHVVKIRHVIRLNPCKTSGSQRWNGAIPSLIARATVKIVNDVLSFILIMVHSPVVHAFRIVENKIRAEAAACVKKYFVADSVARGWCILVIKGIIASVLISSPIHARNQCELDSVVVVPTARLDSSIDNAYGLISKRGILTNIFGVWAQKLNLAYLTDKKW